MHLESATIYTCIWRWIAKGIFYLYICIIFPLCTLFEIFQRWIAFCRHTESDQRIAAASSNQPRTLEWGLYIVVSRGVPTIARKLILYVYRNYRIGAGIIAQHPEVPPTYCRRLLCAEYRFLRPLSTPYRYPHCSFITQHSVKRHIREKYAKPTINQILLLSHFGARNPYRNPPSRNTIIIKHNAIR